MSLSALLAAFFLPGNLLAGDAEAKQAEVTEFVRSYMDAFNEQKLEAISEMWAKDAASVDLATGETTNGLGGGLDGRRNRQGVWLRSMR